MQLSLVYILYIFLSFVFNISLLIPTDMEVKPIGYINSLFTFKNGTPRQPSVCPFARGTLQVDKSIFTNPEHSLEGLEEFSHVW